MGRGRARTATGTLLCVGLLLAACSGTSGTGGSADESPPTVTPPSAEEPVGAGTSDAPSDAPADDGTTGPGSGDVGTAAGSDGDGAVPDDAAVLLEALARFDELRRADTAEVRGYCLQLSDWEALRAESAVVDQVEDAGLTLRDDTLVMFGCAAARQGPQLLGVQVTVERGSVELDDLLLPATTPAGREVVVGTGRIGDLSLFSQAPVSAAVLVGQDASMHLTAVPDVLTPEQLVPLVDAALQDLAAPG